MNRARMQLLLRKSHRWLGLVAGIQLLLWTVSGLYFTLYPIEQVRGDSARLEAPSALLRHTAMLPPSRLASMHVALHEVRVEDVSIVERLGTAAWLVRTGPGTQLAFDAATGAQLPQLNEAEALRIAAARTTLLTDGAGNATLITSTPPGSEYRGGELPAWRVVSPDANTAAYVGAISGQLRAIRTNEWRLFDLLWSLHIMDYDERENFSHWLIRVFAALGVITVTSGLLLFFVTLRFRGAGGRSGEA